MVIKAIAIIYQINGNSYHDKLIPIFVILLANTNLFTWATFLSGATLTTKSLQTG